MNNMVSLGEINLLVIADRYPHEKDPISLSFVKSQVDCLKNHVNHVYVISLTPFVPKFLSNFSFMNPRWRRDAFAHNYNYTNVSVYFAKHFTLPFESVRKRRGDAVLKAVEGIVQTQKIDFDIIHAHFIYPSGYVGTKLKTKYDTPLIITGHGHDVYDLPFKNSHWNKQIRNILSKSDHVITPSKSNYDKLLQLGVPAKRLSIIPNGHDSTLFKKTSMNAARKLLNLPSDQKIILSVGNLESVKGHKYLIEAMNIIVQREKNILCLVVGAGSQSKELTKLVKCLDMNNCLDFVGPKPHDEIPLWMTACDVFVLPSLKEGNPTVMFEALGCCKPFVGTTVGGIPEIIINDKLGILVEPKDADGLARAIRRALDIEWDAEYIQRYAKQFTWEKIAEDILEDYAKVLK